MNLGQWYDIYPAMQQIRFPLIPDLPQRKLRQKKGEFNKIIDTLVSGSDRQIDSIPLF